MKIYSLFYILFSGCAPKIRLLRLQRMKLYLSKQTRTIYLLELRLVSPIIFHVLKKSFIKEK
eukprot:UN02360